MKKILILTFMLAAQLVQAQKFEFYPSSFIRFLGENNDTLYNALTGGLNNPMFSNIDLNGDGRQDLFVFDRRDSKILTFLSVKTRDSVRLQYAPQYEHAFPKMQHWVILKDFNGDGKADIFMHGAGIGAAYSSHLVVYKNVSTSNELKFEPYKLPVMRRTANGIGKITTDNEEVPTFADMDNDGDLDMLQFDFTQSSVVYYYKNMSMEKYSNKDSLNFDLYSQCWGFFSEFDTAAHVEVNVTIGKKNCMDNLTIREKNGAHDGSALLALDVDGDGDKDLLIGDVDRPNLIYLENGRIQGQQTYRFDTIISRPSGNFPLSGTAARIMSLPLASLVDINGDNYDDLLVSPLDFSSKRKNFIWHYHNSSKTLRPRFTLAKSSFLEDKMIEWGSFSHPAIVYYNNDSLPDLLLSVQGEVEGVNRDHLVLYLNIGTKEKAVFKLENKDFMAFSIKTGSGIVGPAIGDADGDGKADLLLGHVNGTVSFYRNTGTNGQASFEMQEKILMAETGTGSTVIDVGNNSRPTLADIDKDGKPDMLIGNSQNQIAYYRNITTEAGKPLFELVNEEYLVIPVTGENQLAPCLADIDQNGTPDLLVGSSSGNIYTFANITDTTKTFTSQTNIFYNHTSKAFGAHTLGQHTTIAVGNLDQDGKPDLLIGTVRGGLYFMGSKNNGQEIPLSVQPVFSPDAEPASLVIYPNPAQQHITLKWSNIQPQQMQAVITDISGKQLWNTGFYAGANASQQQIQLPVLANGLYFVRISGSKGQVYSTQKLFIAH